MRRKEVGRAALAKPHDKGIVAGERITDTQLGYVEPKRKLPVYL